MKAIPPMKTPETKKIKEYLNYDKLASLSQKVSQELVDDPRCVGAYLLIVFKQLVDKNSDLSISELIENVVGNLTWSTVRIWLDQSALSFDYIDKILKDKKNIPDNFIDLVKLALSNWLTQIVTRAFEFIENSKLVASKRNKDEPDKKNDRNKQ
jgi:hypothetical protein